MPNGEHEARLDNIEEKVDVLAEKVDEKADAETVNRIEKKMDTVVRVANDISWLKPGFWVLTVLALSALGVNVAGI